MRAYRCMLSSYSHNRALYYLNAPVNASEILPGNIRGTVMKRNDVYSFKHPMYDLSQNQRNKNSA